MSVLIFFAVVFFIVWLLRLVFLAPPKNNKKAFSKSFLVSGSLAERKLLSICFGDSARVAALIDYEIARCGSMSRASAAQSALERIYADRSR